MKQSRLLCSVFSVERLVKQCILYASAFILAYWLWDFEWIFNVFREFLSSLQLQHMYRRKLTLLQHNFECKGHSLALLKSLLEEFSLIYKHYKLIFFFSLFILIFLKWRRVICQDFASVDIALCVTSHKCLQQVLVYNH